MLVLGILLGQVISGHLSVTGRTPKLPVPGPLVVLPPRNAPEVGV